MRNKIILSFSFVLVLFSVGILTVKATTIETSVLNTVQVIKQIIISNNGSTLLGDRLIDLNSDGLGTVYIKNKVGIGTNTPKGALDVSGNIYAQNLCDANGDSCTSIPDLMSGNITLVEKDPTIDTGNSVYGKICTYNGTQIVCAQDPGTAGVDTNYYLNSGSFNSGSKILLLEMTGGANNISIVLSGIYTSSGDEQDPSIPICITGDSIIKRNSGTNLRECGKSNVFTGIDDYSITTDKISTGAITTDKISTGGFYNISGLNISGSLIVSGDITSYSTMYAQEFLYSSDERFKTDFSSINSALSRILKLKGYNFHWINNGKADIGLIAQEVEKIFPVLVHTNENGYKSVKYGNLVAPIIEAIKELYNKVVNNQNDIDKLKQQNIELKNRIEILEKTLSN